MPTYTNIETETCISFSKASGRYAVYMSVYEVAELLVRPFVPVVGMAKTASIVHCRLYKHIAIVSLIV